MRNCARPDRAVASDRWPAGQERSRRAGARPLRIGVDGRPLRHPYTGIGIYTLEVLSRLAGEHELFVYLDRPDGAWADAGPPFRARYRSAPAGLPRPLAVNVLFARWAARDAVDVFFAPRHHLPAMLGATPSVVTIHDLVWRVAPSTMLPANRLADTALMPVAVKRASRVIAVSNDTAARLAAYRRRGVHVIHEAGRELPAKAPFAHPRPFFLFVGTREPRKNLSGMLEGFRRARRRGLPEVDLVLAGGPGWREDGLEAAIADDEHVVDLGAVGEDRLASLYSSCVALVMASHYEGFGLPVVEAMRHGKPAIAASTGALPETAGDAALLVDPADADDIARGFLALGADNEALGRLGAAARRRADDFSWDRAAAATARVLRAAARDAGGG